MTHSNLKKLFLSFSIFICSIFIAPSISPVHAENFSTSLNATFTAKPTGSIDASLNFEITNLTTDLYTKSFTLNLENVSPKNTTVFFPDTNKEISLNPEISQNQKIIKFEFPDKAVGKGSTQKFQIKFSDSSLIKKTGNIWEISLPKLSQTEVFKNPTINLEVPKSFGQLSTISPQPSETKSQGTTNIYTFNQPNISSKVITANFGNLQTYSLDLTYHLENPLNSQGETSIAIPPDTAFQKVSYTKIDPKPTNINPDEDGNWIATFLLKPKEKIDVNVKGYVQVFSSPQQLPPLDQSTIQKNLSETKYWQTQNPTIKLVASSLSNVNNVYNFTVNHLTYNYALVQPTTKRLGAINAYLNPNQATCMEFTDLFIALARSKGTPSREINGYAYTQNPQLEPLSLVTDVLHAWPEYYDSKKQLWVPVDPTWENTSGKSVDYFNSFDLRHITFAIHGTSSETPYPAGSYKTGTTPQKDVFVKLTTSPEAPKNDLQLKAQTTQKIPIGKSSVIVTITNNGSEAVYNQKLNIFFDQTKKQEINVPSLLPLQSKEFKTAIPYGLTGKDAPQTVKLIYANKDLTISTNKNYTALIAATSSLFIIFTLSVILFLRFHK